MGMPPTMHQAADTQVMQRPLLPARAKKVIIPWKTIATTALRSLVYLAVGAAAGELAWLYVPGLLTLSEAFAIGAVGGGGVALPTETALAIRRGMQYRGQIKGLVATLKAKEAMLHKGLSAEWTRWDEEVVKWLLEAQAKRTQIDQADWGRVRPNINQDSPDFVLLRQLGKGGMGVVYLVGRLQRDLTTQTVSRVKRVAAKTILLSDLLQGNQEAIQQGAIEDQHGMLFARLRREAESLSQLQGIPQVVQLLEYRILRGQDLTFIEQATGVSFPPGTKIPAFIMEYVQGEMLDSILENAVEQFSPNMTAYVAREIALALVAAHLKGYIHRDLKPGNVFLLDNGTVKVTDFGLAKNLAEVGETLTQTKFIIGTPQYMSPEQWRDSKRADHRTDLYALGALMYELLAGSPAYGDTDGAMEYGRLVLAGNPPPRIGGVPEELMNIVLRLMEHDPNNRYQSAQEVVDALTAFIGTWTWPSV